MRSPNQGSNTPLTATRFRAVAFVAAFFGFGGVSSVSGAVHAKIPISTQKLLLMGVKPDEILSAQFVQFREPTAALAAESWEISNAPKLVGVQTFGQVNPGTWLRTRCTNSGRQLEIDECKGTVCSLLRHDLKTNEKKHKVMLHGEYGNYTFAAANLGSMFTGSSQVDANTCRLQWPAWAVGARRLNREEKLNVPRQLLVIQTSSNLFWYDALAHRVWNKTLWPASQRGIFSAVEASDDGQILLKANQGSALYLDFARGHALSLNQNSVQSATFGLNGLFGPDAWSTAGENIILSNPNDESKIDVNLGGIWWKRQFITWNSTMLALSLNKAPQAIQYENEATLLHSSWTDDSGQEKSKLLFEKNGTLRLSSLEAGSSKFVSIADFKTMRFSDRVKKSRLIPNGNTLSAIDAENNFLQIEDEVERLQIAGGADAQFKVAGTGLFVVQKRDKKTCKIDFLGQSQNGSGLTQELKVEPSSCNFGTGHSSDGTSLTEIGDFGLKIHVISN